MISPMTKYSFILLNGNLKSIGRLLEGATPEFAIERLDGVRCGSNSTSCGDQLARAIKQAING